MLVCMCTVFVACVLLPSHLAAQEIEIISFREKPAATEPAKYFPTLVECMQKLGQIVFPHCCEIFNMHIPVVH